MHDVGYEFRAQYGRAEKISAYIKAMINYVFTNFLSATNILPGSSASLPLDDFKFEIFFLKKLFSSRSRKYVECFSPFSYYRYLMLKSVPFMFLFDRFSNFSFSAL